MGELTRQELDTKLDAVKSWMAARFAEQQARVDVRSAEQQTRIDVRFAEQDAKIETRFAEQRLWLEARLAEEHNWTKAQFTEQRYWAEGRFANIELRFAQLDAKMKGQVVQLVKWMVGLSFAMLALTVAIFAFMLNVAVTALTIGSPGADATGNNVRGGANPAVLLHRFQRHHQPRLAGRDPRRHVLHAAEAQVFHPE